MSSLQKFHRRTNSGVPAIVNTLHTGTVSISGTVAVGSVLSVTSTIADVNGLGTFAYQWNRSGTAISGATSSTYTLASADTGNTITVTITYTDGNGFIETETSAPTITVPIGVGHGNDTKGYYMGTAGDGTSYMYMAPFTTEANKDWGSFNTVRGTVSTTNGIANTNTLVSFGTAAHPAAGHCKYLTTGGYNTWYLPAVLELVTTMSNKSALPFATNNGLSGSKYYSSTEINGKYANLVYSNASYGGGNYRSQSFPVRAIRRTNIHA